MEPDFYLFINLLSTWSVIVLQISFLELQYISTWSN
jgi:hypothetical protein